MTAQDLMSVLPVHDDPEEDQPQQQNDTDYGQQRTGISAVDEHLAAKRLHPSQEDMRYLLSTEEDVKNSGVKDDFWALNSRHLQLMDIESEVGLPSFPLLQMNIRDIIRTSSWTRQGRKIPYHLINQQEFYAGKVLLSKSSGRGERVLLATSILKTEHEKTGEDAPQPKGILTRIRGLLGGK